MYVAEEKDVEEVRRAVFSRLPVVGKVKVMVASEEFYVDSSSFDVLAGHLRRCIADRFIPWVYIYRGLSR